MEYQADAAAISFVIRTKQGLQAMDNSHVALVTVQLDADQFDFYRCDRNMPLGVNVSPDRLAASASYVHNDEPTRGIQLLSLTKILRCAKDHDIVTLKATDDADNLGLIFESPSEYAQAGAYHGRE
jgi:proliferating cell nuclear antigen